MNANGSDLATDDSLYPAVIVSLLAHRTADLDDLLPNGTTGRTGGDRQGYWGDTPLPGDPDYPTPNLTGSRLWLLARSEQTDETLRQAEAYAIEALTWMMEDDVAETVTAVASYPQLGQMLLQVTVTQGGASQTYDTFWTATMQAAGVSGLA